MTGWRGLRPLGHELEEEVQASSRILITEIRHMKLGDQQSPRPLVPAEFVQGRVRCGGVRSDGDADVVELGPDPVGDVLAELNAEGVRFRQQC